MMAKKLKCWKKQGRNNWARNLDKSLVTVDVMQETGSKDYLFRRVEHRIGSNVGKVRVRVAKTKPQAIKFAKSWMMKHNKC